METEFEKALSELTPIQREAVQWGDGALLVLAGPGAGKTKVLTMRISRLLKETSGKRFRILALTFTTKAAAEMRERVESLLPVGVADERTFISTFHSFCTDILRQHGSHIGIKPDFGIYGQRDDREELLAEAIQDAIKRGEQFAEDDVHWLDAIDEMKSRLVTPDKVGKRIRDPHMASVYRLYEEALHAHNVMDYNSLLLETCRLLATMPAIATRLRSSYPYWMIDEFQDTSPAQWWLLHYLSGGVFRNIVVVADDDQIIYQWAGASYRQIEKFRTQFTPTLIQLVENHRCPPEIVEVANRLVAHNTQRTPDKKPTTATREARDGAISVRVFGTDDEERDVLSDELYEKGEREWGNIVLLARTRALLEPMLNSLRCKGAKAVFMQRRDEFISPQFVWLQAVLDQTLRPSNKRVFTILVNAANRVAELELDPVILIAEADAAGHSYFEHWATIAASSSSTTAKSLGQLVQKLAHSRNSWKTVVQSAIPLLIGTAKVDDGAVSDASEDYAAWMVCMKEIRSESGQEPELSEVVQGLALRSKEPPRDPNSIALLTIHTAKGLEFDSVYVIGLAEGEMPSWQSVKKGATSPEMEEERRNCFVAITRTRERLTLSRAKSYRGWKKEPSRFLKEMSLIG